MKRLLAAVALLTLAGCPEPNTPQPQPSPTTIQPVTQNNPQSADERPTLGPPVPYKAPEVETFTTSEGVTVWLLTRPSLPLVSLSLSIPTGSIDDPLGKAGLAHISAAMLDEGAGDRDAIEISTGINDLGASLYTRVGVDGTRVSLSVVKKHLDEAFDIFADVVARPRFDAKEWKRVHELWLNELEERGDDPSSVAGVLRRAVLYGPDTPYGHPTSGYRDSAAAITLADARSFYQDTWRPDRAQLVVAGAITKAEVLALVQRTLADWKKPATPPPDAVPPPKPLTARPKLVLVDRPDAPQSVINVVGPGVASNDPAAPLLDLVNTALGGSFTSRLNQNLREDNNWTYGAGSYFTQVRGTGAFIATSAVFTKVTGPALREMQREIAGMAADGLSAEELDKVRARDLTELIETNETLEGLVGRLATLSSIGLPPDHDAKASAARQQATLAQLNALAKQHLDLDKASIIVVGPKDQVVPQLQAIGLGEPEMWTEEGRPAKAK